MYRSLKTKQHLELKCKRPLGWGGIVQIEQLPPFVNGLGKAWYVRKGGSKSLDDLRLPTSYVPFNTYSHASMRTTETLNLVGASIQVHSAKHDEGVHDETNTSRVTRSIGQTNACQFGDHFICDLVHGLGGNDDEQQ